jgi:hypothetical protein
MVSVGIFGSMGWDPRKPACGCHKQSGEPKFQERPQAAESLKQIIRKCHKLLFDTQQLIFFFQGLCAQFYRMLLSY